MKRLYWLQVYDVCLPGCLLCEGVGCCDTKVRSREGFLRALKRATSGEYGAILLPPNFILHPDRDWFLEQTQQANIKLILQIHPATLQPVVLNFIERISWAISEYRVMFSSKDIPSATFIEFIQKKNKPVEWIWTILTGNNLRKISLPPEIRNSLSVYFPVPKTPDDRSLSIGKVHKAINQLRVSLPEVGFPQGIDVWNPGVSEDLDLEPLISPTVQTRTDSPNISFSVIIPTYNNKKYLLNVLRHLARQEYSADGFEIIVVDDGSDDGTEAAVREWISEQVLPLNFKYLYFPRPRPRQMGDNQFRAGIARNLGVKWAQGAWLSFLDSDILVPVDFLKKLEQEHRDAEVVQCIRDHLTEEASARDIRYETVCPAEDLLDDKDMYWQRFFNAKDWMSLPFFWKYTCTYALSMPVKMFKEVGWFRKVYVHYGFEDTDIGYRLAKMGARFKLSSIRTLHLFHTNQRSEFENKDLVRMQLLAKTARLFFRQSLDPEIFLHLRSLMSNELSWPYRFFYWIGKGLGYLSSPLKQGFYWLVRALAVGLENQISLLIPRTIRQSFKQRMVMAGVHLRWGFDRLFGVTFRFLLGQTWRFRVGLLRAQAILWRWTWVLSFPIRKFYYFTEYQYYTRIRPARRGNKLDCSRNAANLSTPITSASNTIHMPRQ